MGMSIPKGRICDKCKRPKPDVTQVADIIKKKTGKQAMMCNECWVRTRPTKEADFGE